MAGSWTLSGNEVTLQQHRAEGLREPGALHVRHRRRARQLRAGRRRLQAAPDDPRSQPVAAAGRVTCAVGRGASCAPPGPARGALPRVAPGAGHWPSFRGREASAASPTAEPARPWNPATGENILWRTPIPGLAHSSPIVWGDTIFVTSAISSRKDATFKPGLYGDGDASDDRSRASLDALRDRQAHRQDPLGAHRGAGRAAQQAAHQVHLRERLAGHRRPHRRRVVRIAGHLRLRRRRRPALVGRSRPRRHGRVRHSVATNGGRPARRSSGTAW